MEQGKCPKCDAIVTDINVAEVTLTSAVRSVKGLTFNCSACNAVLGVTIDPAIMRNQIAAAVKQIAG